MKPANQSRPSATVVRPHPPERLVRALARGEVAASCGCCCCCCCLHSAGGLAGAFVGSFYPAGMRDVRRKATPPVGLRDDELGGPTAAAPARPGLLVPTIFWRSTAVLTLLGIIALSLGGGQVLVLGVSMVVMGFPAVLLCSSVVSAIILAARPSVRRDTRRWKQLGWITLGTVVGTLIGGAVMMPFFRN